MNSTQTSKLGEILSEVMRQQPGSKSTKSLLSDHFAVDDDAMVLESMARERKEAARVKVTIDSRRRKSMGTLMLVLREPWKIIPRYPS